MGSGPTIVRLARGGSSALDLDTEAGRAFLQERLAFYNKLCFLLSGGFFLVGALLMASVVSAPGEVPAGRERRATLLHAATLVVQLAAWLVCARGRRFPLTTLRAIDAAALVLACLGFALQSVTCLEKDPAHRPATASALRDALREVPGVAEWTEDDARAWWHRWRARHTGPAGTLR
jgi:hypothetical protein